MANGASLPRVSAELCKRPPEVAHRLANALLVLDEREADVTLTTSAEANPGRGRHARVGDKVLGELERAHFLVGLGHGCPNEHGADRLGNRPANAVEALDEGVPTGLVDGVYGLRVIR